MNVKRLAVVLLGCFAILFLAASQASAQDPSLPGCSVTLVGRTAPDLNAEGIAERAGDFKIQGANCFAANQPVTVSFNAVMSAPGAADGLAMTLGSVGTYWTLSDPTDSLAIGGVSVQTAVTATGIVTVIEFDVETGSTSPSATLTLENLRFDVTGSTGPSSGTSKYQNVGDGSSLYAYVSTQYLGVENYTFPPLDIGNVKKTVYSAGVSDLGWGFEDGVCPYSFGCGYPNRGATTGSLIDQPWWKMTTNGWATDFPFRRTAANGDPSPNAADPHQIGPTDLVINVENIMAGVTVTLPSKLIVCTAYPLGADAGIKLAEWDWVGGAQTATGGNLVGIYQTVYGGTFNYVTLKVGASNLAADNGCDATSLYPLIYIHVGDPSLNSPDGTMQAYLNVVMGPATTAQFTGDDAQASAIPRYLNDVSPIDLPTRDIIGADTITDPNVAPYFFLNPTQTVLLYPYVTNLDGWNTGIQIANTGNDSTVFGNTGQNGALDFYFFPTPSSSASGTPFVYTAKAGDGRGLDAKGYLDAGGDFAITLSQLLTAAGYAGNFDGYIIVVAHFNFGHGNGMLFSSAGDIGTTPALILGGSCSYNKNNAPPNSSGNGPGHGPFCSSARQGDVTKLPERLEN